jgi:hypothetical protein
VLLALALLAIACGGGEEAGRGELAGLAELRGKTLGVASAEGVASLETRYVLRLGYKLETATEDGDVAMMEAPAESLTSLLLDGEIDAAVLPERSAFQLLQDEEGVYLLSHVSEEMRDLTGEPVLASVLVTYPDVAAAEPQALDELNALLAESLTYFHANADAVIDAVATQSGERDYLHWWWERHDARYGDLTPPVQEQLIEIWEAGRAVGDIEGYPDLASVLFDPDGGSSDDAARATVTLGVLDDPGRRCALYAIEAGIAVSDAIDANITYLPQSALQEAAIAKYFEVIEAGPLLVPQATASDLPLLVLSGGVQDLDGTLLFVRSTSADTRSTGD